MLFTGTGCIASPTEKKFGGAGKRVIEQWRDLEILIPSFDKC